MEEVLHRQSPAVQSFLMRTSVLSRMCPALCDAVTQDLDGHRMLVDLERANLFVVPLDNDRHWFRYHRLFAELLRQRLAQRESAVPLLILASQWHEAQGQPVEAFQQAFAAGDVDRAIHLIGGDGMPLYCRGAMAPVSQAIQALPPQRARQPPLLVADAGLVADDLGLPRTRWRSPSKVRRRPCSAAPTTRRRETCGDRLPR